MKKSVNVVALLVFVATNVFTPFSYAVDDENQISPTDILISSEISEPLIVDDEENVGGEEKDIGGEETEKPNVSVETQNNEDGDLEGNKLQILEELKEIVIDPLLMLDRTEEEIVDDSEKLTDDDMDEEVIGSREIYGTGEHKNVKVEVYAETGAFEETPILIIESLESEKETEIKKAILTYNEDTEELDEEEIEEEAEEKITEVVAFDIKFLDKEENEVQPKEGMVKVEFNFTENEILEETEEHEVKVYHLNDKDEEGNTIDEIKDMEIDEPELTENKEVAEEKITEEDNEEQIVTVVGDKFSIYTIVQQVKEEGPLAENENQLANFEYGEISIARPSDLDASEYPIEGFTIMDRNLGAINNDITSTGSYGYKYQWGNNYGFSDSEIVTPVTAGLLWRDSYNNSGYISKSFINGQNHDFDVWSEDGEHHDGVWGGENDSEDNGYGITFMNYSDRQGPCPSGWHVPSAGEWGLLIKYWAETNNESVSEGWSEGLFYTTNVTAFQQKFDIPLAGARDRFSASLVVGSDGNYWSSSPYFDEGYKTDSAYRLQLLSYNDTVDSDSNNVRSYGFSVRCFKNTYSGTGDIHTITFDFNGGSGSTAAINVVSGEKAIEPEDPKKEGFVFDGWYTNSGENDNWGDKFNFNKTSITSNKTLYAKWLSNSDIAILKTGKEFNAIIKTLANGGTPVDYNTDNGNIEHFVRYEGEDIPESKQKISLEGFVDVYAWYSGDNTIYYSTDADKIYMNEDSSNMFGNLTSIASLNLTDYDTSKVTNMSSMFWNCSSLESIDLSNFDTSNVTAMGAMFFRCSSLKYLDLSNFDTSNVTAMGAMFFGGSSLTGLILDGWDLTNLLEGSSGISSMFNGATALEKVSTRGWKIPTTFISAMGCSTSQLCAYLDELDVTDWNLGWTTDINGLFASFYGAEIKGLETWNTESITNMSYMFQDSNVTTLELNNFNTDNVVDMSYMFENSKKLNVLDLSSFVTHSSTKINGMFNGMTNLHTIYASSNFVLSDEDAYYVFVDDNLLVGGNGFKYDSLYAYKNYARIDTRDNPGYFTDPNNFTVRYLSGDEVVANLTGKVGGTATGLNDGERIYSYYSDSTKNNPYDFEQTLSGYTEIYVSWVDKLALTLDANGGYVSQSGIESDNEGNVTLPNATRGADENGERVFEGWFASTGMSEKIGNSGDVINITGDTTLYAHWAQTIKIWDPANPLSGFIIMDRNLGAVTNDRTNTGSYGFHYQWGNNYGFDSNKIALDEEYLTGNRINVPEGVTGYYGKQFVRGNINYSWMNQNIDTLWGGENDSVSNGRGVDDIDQTVIGRQGPCPEGWHVPSAGEWGLLIKYWGDMSGAKVTGSNNLFHLNNKYSDFQQYFKLPFAGRRNFDSASLASYGFYWSSSPYSSHSDTVRTLNLGPSNTRVDNVSSYRADGVSVRCFKDEYVAPETNNVAFDGNGGDITIGNIIVVSGSTVNLSGYMASMDGWNFTGWNINSGAHEGMDSITVTGDVTLYAIFSKEMTSNFVLRDPNAASLDETTASCTAYNGGYCIVTAPTLTKKSGYTVDGWSADEGNEITTIFTGGNTFNSVTHYDVPVSITFYQNGNGGTGYEVRTCYKYNGAGSCKIASPSISVSEGFIVQGWSDSPDYHGSSWYANSEADKYYDESYYAQAYLPVSVTFLANNNLVDGGSYAERYCTRYNGAKCYVTTPTITSIGSNTPEIVGYTLSADGVSSADIESNSGLYISGRETYYAHTKKSKVTLVAKWDGNNSTLSSYEDSDCELPEVYDGAAQISGCTVIAPVITAPEATPIVIGFNTGENATTNSDSYNTGNGKLFLTEDSHNQTWYAITYMSGKVLTIDYSIGAGVYSIGKNSDSCTLTGTYNGIAQASSCTVKAPTITVNSGYSDTSKKWTDLSTSSQVDEGEDITLTKDLHYTASAQYQSSTIPETYTITYELNGGTISGEKLVYTVEDPTFTLVNPTWEHHIFAGWTGAGISDPQLVVTISQGTKFENLTYYANWYEDFNDNGINDAIEPHFLVKYTDGVDGETVFEDQIFNEVLSGLATPLFVGTPERAGYDFLGWSPEVSEFVLDDVEYVARWNKQSSGGGNSSGGGGKRLPIVDTHGVADDEKASSMDENKEAEEKSETEDSQANQQDETKNNDGENSQGEDDPDYPDEFVDAYSFSRINGITTVGKIQDAKMYGNLTRIEMAKMLSNYAINVLGKKPDTSKTIKFKDVTNKMDKKYDNGVLLSYQLGIMGINVKNKKFRPNDLVTRAEFATALSRTLFGGEEGKYKSTRKYYEPHIAKLYNEGIINNTDPNMKEKRGYVMIMLMRSVGVK